MGRTFRSQPSFAVVLSCSVKDQNKINKFLLFFFLFKKLQISDCLVIHSKYCYYSHSKFCVIKLVDVNFSIKFKKLLLIPFNFANANRLYFFWISGLKAKLPIQKITLVFFKKKLSPPTKWDPFLYLKKTQSYSVCMHDCPWQRKYNLLSIIKEVCQFIIISFIKAKYFL